MLCCAGSGPFFDGFLTAWGEYRAAPKKQEKSSRSSSHRLAIEARNE
jgi:hypothetical protein